MPTQSTTYNSRVTDEALEKRFRDTFRSQGGAELVDDLYAQGVIVPVVDFTAAATGQQLGQNLQTAWDFSTGWDSVTNTTQTIISNAGFWQCDLTAQIDYNASGAHNVTIRINDGATTKVIWRLNDPTTGTQPELFSVTDGAFVVFLRSSDTLEVFCTSGASVDIWYRQIATVTGDLVNPSGFSSS